MPDLAPLMLETVEKEMLRQVARINRETASELHAMLTYHLGWAGAGAGPQARGKRLRPLFVLLTASACGAPWEKALPAAAAVELLHNFSLIHDDIQDKSLLRRGRPTLWAKWGIAQAINAGDTLFTLAHLALLDLATTAPPAAALEAARLLHTTCLELTEGQYLDISYESRASLSLEEYWTMIGGKTAALLAACTTLGALAAGAPREIQQAYRSFGRDLGLAFQVHDDLLGIWGDAEVMGKSAESDLVEGKKSLPVVFGLARKGAFARRWAQGPVTPAEVEGLAAQLEAEGAFDYVQEKAAALTRQALHALESANPQGEAGEMLAALAKKLLRRQE